ncbi:serine O-acetyltransferase [Aquisalimonas lutea]|uniref:serine O-acetyltransferase n=1 Tax=Aquisalimonas lutea TaxID=1327750 RepID=UPI0025B345AC|nr:serine O-acetyltransferase [Aquisalimonas lutea]MDN3517898.1 serine O-acetyltransferase [Aquisalimonas lutea]
MFARIREDIRCVFERDPAARNAFEVLTCYPGLHALLWHRLCHRLWGWRLRWLARFVSLFARWITGIEIHPGARIGRRFFIDHGMGVVIGETAEIGDDCTLYHGVTLGGTTLEPGKRHPSLGDDVVVGAGAKVLGPVHVGSGARVGSNAVVIKDVPEGATMVGIPARMAGQREEKTPQRQATARKIGFDAYGTTDMPDPVSQAINSILDHIHVTDERLVEMCRAVQELGGRLPDARIPDLDCTPFENGQEPEQEPGRETVTEQAGEGDGTGDHAR